MITHRPVPAITCVGSQTAVDNRQTIEVRELAQVQQLDKVAGKQTLELTHYGRKTGKPYQVTIWFVVDGERIFIGTANVIRQWVRNVQKTPAVKLLLGGQTFEGEARFLVDRGEHERAQAKFRKKYWMYAPVFALARVLLAFGLMTDRTGCFEVTLKKSV